MDGTLTPDRGSDRSSTRGSRKSPRTPRYPARYRLTPADESEVESGNGEAQPEDICHLTNQEESGEDSGDDHVYAVPPTPPHPRSRVASPGSDNDHVQPQTRDVTRSMTWVITGIIIAYFGISAVLGPFLPLDQPPGQLWSGVNVLQAAETAPREPIGHFKDCSALFRAWARFSAARSYVSFSTDRYKDQRGGLPVLTELLAEGDTWNRLTGELANGTEPLERTIDFDRTNSTHIDLAALDVRLTASMDLVSSRFMQTSGTLREGGGHLDILRRRIASLRDGASKRQKATDRKRTVQKSDKSRTVSVDIDGFRPLQFFQLFQESTGACDPPEIVHRRKELTESTRLIHDLSTLLDQLQTLHTVIAHTVSTELKQTRSGVEWAPSPLLARSAMVLAPESQLHKATAYAMMSETLAQRHERYDEVQSRFQWLLNALAQIIQCEIALEKHTKMLLSATQRPGLKTDSPYIWLPTRKAWLTIRPTEPLPKDAAKKIHSLGLPACAPLHSYPYHDHSVKEANVPKADKELVLVYVPLAHYVHNMLEEDFRWVYEMERKLRDDSDEFTRW